MYRRDQSQCFRDAQHARISRWIRDSEAGWIFLAPQGQACHLLSNEAEALEREGQALVERAVAGGFAPARAIRALVGCILVLGVGLAIKAPEHALESIFLPMMMIVCLLTAGKKVLNEFAYEWALRSWRRSTARKLERARRGGVPEAIATYHRRYNLFQLLFMTSLLLLLGRFLWMGLDTSQASWVDAALLGVCLTMLWPMQQIDRTHRRRKWFD